MAPAGSDSRSVDFKRVGRFNKTWDNDTAKVRSRAGFALRANDCDKLSNKSNNLK